MQYLKQMRIYDGDNKVNDQKKLFYVFWIDKFEKQCSKLGLETKEQFARTKQIGGPSN